VAQEHVLTGITNSNHRRTVRLQLHYVHVCWQLKSLIRHKCWNPIRSASPA